MTNLHYFRSATLAVSLCAAAFANAQLVFIPDVNLRGWFNSTVPGSVDVDGYLDTSLPALAEVDTVFLDLDWTPFDLTGVEYLNGLEVLQIACYHHPGTFNAWPPNLTYLSIEHYQGTSLPSLPASLREFYLLDIPLTELPTLPGALEILQIGQLDAPSIGPFPATLEVLELYGIWPQLTEIVSLPASLLTFQLLGNAASVNIQCLPQLPDGLELLYYDIILGGVSLCLPNIPTNPAFVCSPPLPVCEAGSDCAITTGLIEQGGDMFTIWPNPVQDVLTVEREGGGMFQLAILDATGRLVRRTSGVGALSRITVTDLQSGAYALQLNDARGERILRFVKD